MYFLACALNFSIVFLLIIKRYFVIELLGSTVSGVISFLNALGLVNRKRWGLVLNYIVLFVILIGAIHALISGFVNSDNRDIFAGIVAIVINLLISKYFWKRRKWFK